jgi:hypothetical protein
VRELGVQTDEQERWGKVIEAFAHGDSEVEEPQGLERIP